MAIRDSEIERNERMAFMFAQGMTLQSIADECSVSHQRVQQILKKLGVSRCDGGQFLVAKLKRDAKQTAREAKCLALYGCSCSEYKKYVKNGLAAAYRCQLKNANARGIAFKLTFVEWLSVWQRSGKIEERGRRKEAYVMSRICDKGGYEVGNVCIKTLQENSREATKKWIGKVKTLPRGVFESYPGREAPYLAKVGKKSLGLFRTPDEASAARRAFIQSV